MTQSQVRYGGNGDQGEFGFWRDHTHINLSPVAAPSVLGLYGFAVATFMVAANLAGWYGNDTTTPLVLAPFAFAIGGVAQFLAGMWSYRARDALATAMHGSWGSFWIAYGIYHLLVAIGTAPSATAGTVAGTAFGFWFIGLAAVTVVGAFAASGENIALASVLYALAGGAALLAIGLIAGIGAIEVIAGYVLIVSAILAWYTASAMLLESTLKRVVLPMGKLGSEPNVPGKRPKQMIQYEVGEPGVKVGQ